MKKLFAIFALAAIITTGFVHADVRPPVAKPEPVVHQFDAGFLDEPVYHYGFELIGDYYGPAWYCIDTSREWSDAADYIMSGPYESEPSCQ